MPLEKRSSRRSLVCPPILAPPDRHRRRPGPDAGCRRRLRQQLVGRRRLNGQSGSLVSRWHQRRAAAKLVPAAIKTQGHAHRRHRRVVRAERVLRHRRQDRRSGWTSTSAKAIGDELGVKVEFKNATFDAIIPGLADGRYDLGMSSFTDTKEREKMVDFVDLLQRRHVVLRRRPTAARRSPALADLCGQKVAVETGTTQDDDVDGAEEEVHAAGKARSTCCPSPTRTRRTSRSSSGRADVGDGRLARSRPTRSSSPTARSSSSARRTARRRTASRSRRQDGTLAQADLDGAQGPDRPTAPTADPAASGASRPARSPTRPSTARSASDPRDAGGLSDESADRTAEIKAVPVRHPGRWVGRRGHRRPRGDAGPLARHARTGSQWDIVAPLPVRPRRSCTASAITLELTVVAMAIGIVGGVVLAVMRLSPNPVAVAVQLGLHLVLPRHAGAGADPVLVQPGRPLSARCRSASRSADLRHTPTPTTLITQLTAAHPRRSASTRPPTWPRSSAPASSRSTRARPRPRRRSA